MHPQPRDGENMNLETRIHYVLRRTAAELFIFMYFQSGDYFNEDVCKDPHFLRSPLMVRSEGFSIRIEARAIKKILVRAHQSATRSPLI